MSWMSQIGGLLQKYRGDSASPQSDASEDFGKIAAQAPTEVLSSGLAQAFRSNSTPEFGDMISHLFAQSDGSQRAGILSHLLMAAGPAVASSGALGSLAGLMSSGARGVTPEQAQQVHPEDVRQLAAAAEQRDPSVIDRASEFYAQHPALVKTLGAGALAVLMSHMSQRH